MVWLLVVVAPGCKMANYSARNLPDPLRVAPMPARNGINLQQMAGGNTGTSQLWPGDLVQITIVSGTNDDVRPLPARVSSDGTVMVPLIGPVAVSGLEPFAAERQIAAAAVERGIYRQPHVALQVTERAVNRVTVMGAVEKPGVVELPRGASDLLSALAAAGGMKAEASMQVDVLRQHGRQAVSTAGGSPHRAPGTDGVQLASYNGNAASLFAPPAPLDDPAFVPGGLPRDPQAMRIDLAQANGPGDGNLELGDCDVVMVHPREKRVIHVTGLVTKPDQFELPPDKDVRVLDAIALAGGLKSPLADKVFVIRQLPDMPTPAVIRVSVSSAKRNGDENLILGPGDLVSVEATMSTMIVDTATNFFRVAVGLSGNIVAF